ncbi:MAG TPA: DUF5069 domain-containing protein [Candidatus Baltobacteraceae bacterium]|nr:DUF5069 domain-containing protein [Candidatus Baltobacteraceae bacterium]
MEPLDLTKHAPRSPREMAGGLYMLGRTIDKMRALIPGGVAGEYRLRGFSERMLGALGIDASEMMTVVQNAANEDEVLQWVHAHSDVTTYDRLNQAMANRRQKDILPEYKDEFAKLYSDDLRAQHDVLFDVIEADDRKAFGV